MRQRLWNENVSVSVQELPSPSLSNSLLSLVSVDSIRDNLFPLLSRRLTVHLAVLSMASVVLAAGAFGTRQVADVASGNHLDTVTAVAPAAIVAHVIPITANHSTQTAYVIRDGDSLSSIAQLVGAPEEAILAYNGLTNSDALSVGMTLELPDPAKVPAEKLMFRDTAPHGPQPLVVPNPQNPAPDIRTHEIQPGDTLLGLAQREGVSIGTIIQANDLTTRSVLSLGEKIEIPVVNGRIITTQPGDSIGSLAQKYGLEAADLLAANKLPATAQTLVPGARMLIPDGAVARPESNSVSAQAQPQASSQAQERQTAQAKDQPAPPPAQQRPVATGGLIWPATGFITTYFTSWHNGIDIANSMGTPVHAAQAGVIVYSGWDNTGYGFMVRIDHGNGLETLYGHASRLLVKTGQRVDEGQVIMLMGSTGHSTGPHVHFSVFRGSSYSALNPLRVLP